MNKKTLGGDHIKKVPPPKARPSRFYGGSATLCALAALRGVRDFGQGKLGLREAILAAFEQGAAFKRWREKGTLVRRVQVWVENQLVMTVSPGENCVKLKAFNFVVPSPREAVMRIMKADEGEEPVVLRNLPLNTVPAHGLDETTPLPNGQRIRLEILPKEAGRFDIKVAFAPEEEEQPLKEIIPSCTLSAKAGAGNTSSISWAYVPTLLSQPRFGYGASTCAVLILALVVGVGASGFRSLMRRAPVRITIVSTRGQNLARAGEECWSVTGLAVPSADAPTQKPSVHLYKVSVKYKHGSVETAGSSLMESENVSCPLRPERFGSTIKPLHFAGVKTEAANLETAIRKTPDDKIDRPPDASEPEVLIPLDTLAQTKLAEVQWVHVTVDDTSPSSETELRVLRTSFVRVLNGSSPWEVLAASEESSPDAVIKLRFEPDTTCLGVVIIEIRDPDGKVLWRARVGCRALPKRDHDEMFADASARLIAKLKEKIEPNQGSDGQR